MSEFYRSTKRTARKEHQCNWCAEMIFVGEKHFDVAENTFGNMNSYRLHLVCKRAMDELWRMYPGEGWTPFVQKRGLPEER